MRALPVVAPLAILIVVVAAAGSLQSQPASAQGCVNQGNDPRVGAPVVCWAQRELSWKSDHRPYFLLIGSRLNTSLGLAWPPYLVFNRQTGAGRWRMFRIGFRYDRNWHGYIFPTAAWKLVNSPLRY